MSPSDDDIHVHAAQGNVDKLIELLDEDPTLVNLVDRMDFGTPLHWAAMYGQVESCKILSSRGADLRLVDDCKYALAGKSHDTGRMSWRELITGIYGNRAHQPGIGGRPEFYPAASAGDIDDAEVRLNARLPACLRSLLLETNGVMDMMSIDGGEWFASMWLLWAVQEIVEQNDFYRRATDDGTYERDFRQLAFFAGAGSDGILFGFPVSEDGTCASRVVVWHPIMDELDELAPSLEDFLRGWLTSTISV